MHFNFYLANHSGSSFVMLEDLVRPIVVGLQECGHHVVTYGTGVEMAPKVNVLVEFFRDPQLVDTLIELKRQLRDGFVFGVICTEDLDDPHIWQLSGQARRDNLIRLLPHADFVWTLGPPGSYLKVCPADRVAQIRYGYSTKLQPACHVDDPRERDLDVLIYGSPYTYRMPVAERLAASGLACEFSVSTPNPPVLDAWPRYLADEILSRSKVVVDMRRGPEVRFLSVTRIAAAVHSGCAVVAEAFDDSELSALYRYTTKAAYQDIAETCRRIIAGGDFVERGQRALAAFRAETSMRDNMMTAMELPLFRRPGIGPSA
jgi:hypothetical protein